MNLYTNIPTEVRLLEIFLLERHQRFGTAYRLILQRFSSSILKKWAKVHPGKVLPDYTASQSSEERRISLSYLEFPISGTWHVLRLTAHAHIISVSLLVLSLGMHMQRMCQKRWQSLTFNSNFISFSFRFFSSFRTRNLVHEIELVRDAFSLLPVTRNFRQTRSRANRIFPSRQFAGYLEAKPRQRQETDRERQRVEWKTR